MPTEPTRRRAERVLALLAPVVGAVYLGGSLLGADDPWASLLHPTDPDAAELLAVCVPVFFLALVGRLVLAARRRPDRALPLLALAAGVALWAVGAATVAMAGPSTTVRYPAPGESWMLSGYLGFATYLFLRPGRGGRRTSVAGLDALITFGGALCLSGALLALPVATAFGRDGVPLLVALLSTTLDIALVLVLVGQVVSGVRAPSRAVARVALGFVVIGAGDTAMTGYMASGTYGKGLVVDACFCLGFGLVASGAAADTGAVPGRPPRAGALVTLLAGVAGVAVLVLRPGGAPGPALQWLGAVTLAAVGGRLQLALREANGAAEARRLSLTDDLTGLPNRRALLAELVRRRPSGRTPSLLLLDLDGFKDINDTLGHAAGDAVLTVIAYRLANAPTTAVLAARLGGDEFALVLDEDDLVALVEVAEGVRALIRKPVDVDGLELAVDCSIGVSPGAPPTDEPTGDPADGPTEVATAALADLADDAFGHRELLRRADVAMYQAKAGRSGVCVYDAARDEFSRRRLELSQELAYALATGGLVVHYQPQVDARTRRVVSVEALARWHHPVRGLVPPGEFLPVARRAGLMPVLTETVIRTALDDLAGWVAAGLDLAVAVNVAPSELLSEPVMASLVDRVREVGLAPSRVVVEVTEDSFLAQPDLALEVILGLREHGLQVSVDDYGTGFSSLAYLKTLPVHELKIDRSFVADVLVDRRAEVVVTSAVRLARGLDMRVVAEGIESEDVARALADIGADLLQGFHLGRPVPAAQVPALVRRAGSVPVGAPRGPVER